MSDGNEIIDVEAVEIEGSSNLPAVVASEAPQKKTHEQAAPIVTKWSEQWWSAQPPHMQARRCVAHSTRTGLRCKNIALQGGVTVCRFHGGAAPQVKRAARVRLENAADLMAKQLLEIALTADGESVKLTAIRDALDRAGISKPAEVVLSQGESKPYESVFDFIGGDPTAAGFPSVTSEDDDSAGVESAPPAMVDQAEDYAQPSSHTGPPRQAAHDNFDRDTQSDGRESARSQARPARPEMHITGEAAMRIANESNRRAGVFEAQRAIESPHKRYRRP